jgi:hypothetical protein
VPKKADVVGDLKVETEGDYRIVYVNEDDFVVEFNNKKYYIDPSFTTLWRVLKWDDDECEIIAEERIKEITLGDNYSGMDDYDDYEKILDCICSCYGEGGRPITTEDVEIIQEHDLGEDKVFVRKKYTFEENLDPKQGYAGDHVKYFRIYVFEGDEYVAGWDVNTLYAEFTLKGKYNGDADMEVTAGIKPIVTLNLGTWIDGGSGTEDDPYIVLLD